MSEPVHQKFTSDLDTKPFEAGLARQESATKTSTSRVVREMDRIQQSANKQASKGSHRAGAVALQVQDIGVQMQQGAKASTIIAQQGSQILSIFGPMGMLLGGLTASAMVFWDAVKASKELTQHQKERLIDGLREETQARKGAIAQIREDQRATKSAEARIKLRGMELKEVSGKTVDDQIKATRERSRSADNIAKAAESELRSTERRLELEKRITEIQNDGKLTKADKGVLEESARTRFSAEERAQLKSEARARSAERVAGVGDDLLGRAAQIRGQAPSRSEVRQEFRQQRRAERRAINEEIDRLDRQERNRIPQGTEKARARGLTQEEKSRAAEARRMAIDVAKDKKLQAVIEQESINKILNGIDNLIAR